MFDLILRGTTMAHNSIFVRISSSNIGNEISKSNANYNVVFMIPNQNDSGCGKWGSGSKDDQNLPKITYKTLFIKLNIKKGYSDTVEDTLLLKETRKTALTIILKMYPHVFVQKIDAGCFY